MEQFESVINAYAKKGWQVREMSYTDNGWTSPYIFALLEKETTPETRQMQQTEEIQ
jgi:hypothetical protein